MVDGTDGTLAALGVGSSSGTTLDTSASGNYSVTASNGTLGLGWESGGATTGNLTARDSVIAVKNLNIHRGTFTQSTSDTTVSGDMTIDSSGVFTKDTGTVTLAGASGTYTDAASAVQNLGTVITDGAVATNSRLKAVSLTVNGSDSLNISGDTLTLTGTGTPPGGSGTRATAGATLCFFRTATPA